MLILMMMLTGCGETNHSLCAQRVEVSCGCGLTDGCATDDAVASKVEEQCDGQDDSEAVDGLRAEYLQCEIDELAADCDNSGDAETCCDRVNYPDLCG